MVLWLWYVTIGGWELFCELSQKKSGLGLGYGFCGCEKKNFVFVVVKKMKIVDWPHFLCWELVSLGGCGIDIVFFREHVFGMLGEFEDVDL